MKSNKNFVLTGSIASGKSQVSEFLKKEGIEVIDADEISRNLTKKNGKALPLIREAFGDEVFSGEELNRKVLSKIVFNDIDKLKKLNSIMHPEIIKEMKRMESEKTGELIVFDIPLYFEILKECESFRVFFKGVIVVYVSEDIELERLMNRDKISKEEAILKINSQIPVEEKIKYADYRIDNSGSLRELEDEVKGLKEWLMSYEF